MATEPVLPFWHGEKDALDVSGPQNPSNDAFSQSNLYCFIAIDATEPLLDLAPSASVPFGILQNLEESAGQTASPVGSYVAVRIGGISQMLISATVTQGQFLKPAGDGSGSGIPVSAAGDVYGAKALQSGNSGDFIDVLLCFGTYYVA